MNDEQRQAILTAFYDRHPEYRTDAGYRAHQLTRYPALPATDADLPQNKLNPA